MSSTTHQSSSSSSFKSWISGAGAVSAVLVLAGLTVLSASREVSALVERQHAVELVARAQQEQPAQDRGGVGEAVAVADDEAVEDVLGVQPRVEAGRSAGLGTSAPPRRIECF